jgi:hypothetical protein
MSRKEENGEVVWGAGSGELGVGAQLKMSNEQRTMNKGNNMVSVTICVNLFSKNLTQRRKDAEKY